MRIVALNFHDVVANGADVSAHSDEFYRITAGEFETLLAQLKQRGYRSVSSKQFRAWQQGQGALPERAVLLTFDDGYTSHFEQVVPLLIRHRFIGTFFVAVDLVGQSGHMSWEQIKRLVFLGMEVGSHGLSHQPLTGMTPAQVAHEVTESKRLLEEKIGVPVRALSAPRGFWSRAIAEAVSRAGYDAAWVSTIGTVGRDTNPFALRRVVVRRPFSAERVISMVEGWTPSFWWAANQQFLIRVLKRMLGVYWYEQLKRRLVPNA